MSIRAELFVAFAGVVHAVFGERPADDAGLWQAAHELEPVDEIGVLHEGEAVQGVAQAGEIAVPGAEVRQGRRQRLQRRRSGDDDAHARGLRTDELDEIAIAGEEVRQAAEALEGELGAVAKQDDGGLEHLEMGGEALQALLRRPEVGTRVAEDGVAAPGEIAHGDFHFAEGEREAWLKGTVTLLALDDGVADEDEAVAVFELEGRGLRRGNGGGLRRLSRGRGRRTRAPGGRQGF
jgi:hypothetical protein